MKTVKPRILDLRTAKFPSDGPAVTVGEGETLVVIAVPSPKSSSIYRFRLESRSKIFVRSLVFPWASADFQIFLEGDSSEADIRSVAISDALSPTSYASKTVSSASGTRAVSNVAAFALSGAELSVSTSAEIGPGVASAYAEAVQSNVLFGSAAKVRGIPELKIASDDVKARHACSVERFSEDRLFYLRSRGLSAPEAVASLVSAKISETFSGLPDGLLSFSENLCQSAISNIVSQTVTA